jgi:DNA mismatch repair protein MutH
MNNIVNLTPDIVSNPITFQQKEQSEQSEKSQNTENTEKQRPSIHDVQQKVIEIANTIYELPKTANKGKPGNYLEQLTGIPTSSECLDCTDGEVKVFPVKKLRSGIIAPKETVAVCMINKDDLVANDFYESRCYKKLSNVLFVGYYREDDKITYMQPTRFDLETHIEIREQLKKDYDTIREHFMKNDTLDGTSKLGVYLQNRTKGKGGNAPKTRAFYLRTNFVRVWALARNL